MFIKKPKNIVKWFALVKWNDGELTDKKISKKAHFVFKTMYDYKRGKKNITWWNQDYDHKDICLLGIKILLKLEWKFTLTSQCLTYGLYKDNVISGTLTENNGLISCSSDSTECSWGRRWPDKSIHVPGEFSHTSLIPQQRPCKERDEADCRIRFTKFSGGVQPYIKTYINYCNHWTWKNIFIDLTIISHLLPPVVQEDGSTASTESLCPRAVNILPTTSMKDDFPAPGGPDRPEKSTKRSNQLQMTPRTDFCDVSVT